jgi:hypothetical protein
MHRRVARADLNAFVLLHTRKPKRPERLTPTVENAVDQRLRDLVRQEVRALERTAA